MSKEKIAELQKALAESQKTFDFGAQPAGAAQSMMGHQAASQK